MESKPASNYRNDLAGIFYVRRREERGIFVSNKPDSNGLQRACWKEKWGLMQIMGAGSFR